MLMFTLKFLPEKHLNTIIARAVSVASSKAKTQEEKDAVDQLFGEAPKDRKGKLALIKKIMKHAPENVLMQADQKVKAIAKRSQPLVAAQLQKQQAPVQKEELNYNFDFLMLTESILSPDESFEVLQFLNEQDPPPNAEAMKKAYDALAAAGGLSGTQSGGWAKGQFAGLRATAVKGAYDAMKKGDAASFVQGMTKGDVANRLVDATNIGKSSAMLFGVLSGPQSMLLGVVVGVVVAAIVTYIGMRVGKKVVGAVRRGVYDVSQRASQAMERSQARADTGTSFA
jgi:hypothetical protein